MRSLHIFPSHQQPTRVKKDGPSGCSKDAALEAAAIK